MRHLQLIDHEKLQKAQRSCCVGCISGERPLLTTAVSSTNCVRYLCGKIETCGSDCVDRAMIVALPFMALLLLALVIRQRTHGVGRGNIFARAQRRGDPKGTFKDYRARWNIATLN